MKSATIPSLRVAPELRTAAEGVLREGETLSGFVEQALRDSIAKRRSQSAFIQRGLAAREEARESGRYATAESVLAEIDTMLDAVRRRVPPDA